MSTTVHAPVPVLPQDILDLLRDFTLFKDAPESFLNQISGRLRLIKAKAQEYIITEGDEAKAMYWLVKGHVSITSRDSEATYAELSPGNFFGEIGILFNCPRTATVVARTNCVLVSLTKEGLNQLLPFYPTVETAIKNEAQERLAVLNKGGRRSSSIENPTSTILEQMPLFKSLPPSSIHRLALSVDPRAYEPFEFIIRQNTYGRDIYIMIQGVAEVIDENSGNVKATLHCGDYFGEVAFLEMAPKRIASIRAVNAVECLVLTEETLDILCAEHPDVRKQMKETAKSRIDIGQKAQQFDPDPYSMAAELPAEVEDFSKSWNINAVRPLTPPATPVLVPLPLESQLSFLFHPRVCKYTPKRKPSLFNFGPLPDNLLLKVFHYLPLHVLMRLQAVCQHWQQLLRTSPLLVRELDLSKYNTIVDDTNIVCITDFAGTRPKIVDISNCFHLKDDGFSYLVNGIGLAKVHVFRMKSVWEVSGMAILDLSVPSIGADLQEIDFSNCRKVNDTVLTRLIGWIVPPGSDKPFPPPGTVVGCPRLKRLCLSYCKNISDRTMYHIAAYCSERLESLDLRRCTSITDKGFACWSSKQFPNLRHLSLADCAFLSDSAILSLAACAKGLVYLNLSFCSSLTDVSVGILAEECCDMQDLDLSYCVSAVSDSSLNQVAANLGKLEILSIRGCVRVTRVGIDMIKMGCSRLMTLDISQCRNVEFVM
jgi:F-box/leucine-rich repeat protein 7